jgi:DNA-binding protein HU-beta
VNKGEFATVIVDRTELSKAAANRALDGILDTLTEAMADHDEVSFSGWSKFSAQRRKGRDANDPRNSERTIHIAPHYVPKFKAGAVLKREVQAARPAGHWPEATRLTPRAATSDTAGATRSAAETGNGRGQDRWRPLGER